MSYSLFSFRHLILLQAEHAFAFWVTGISIADDEKRKEEAKFSEDNWGPSTLSYISSVAARKWAKIKDAARECMTATKSSVTLHRWPATSSPDARGSLFDSEKDTDSETEQ